MDILLKFVTDNPLAYQFIVCISAASIAWLGMIFYTMRVKSLLKLLVGPVPKLSENVQLHKFENERRTLREKADGSAILGGFCTLICVGLGSWIYKNEDAFSYLLVVAGTIQILALAQVTFGIMRYGSETERIATQRSELGVLKYVKYLPEGDVKVGDKLFWGSLDDHSCIFRIGKAEALTMICGPLSLEENSALSDAQWQATNEERPQAGDLALVMWRDGKGKTIKAMATKITAVREAQAETLMNRPGKVIITAAGEKFCGGKLAYFYGAPNERIERGWLCTADRAHVLLTSLRWLDDEQREVCYQLINPGQSFPPISDWSQG